MAWDYGRDPLCTPIPKCSAICGSPPGVMMADTLSFTAKVDLVDF